MHRTHACILYICLSTIYYAYYAGIYVRAQVCGPGRGFPAALGARAEGVGSAGAAAECLPPRVSMGYEQSSALNNATMPRGYPRCTL